MSIPTENSVLGKRKRHEIGNEYNNDSNPKESIPESKNNNLKLSKFNWKGAIKYALKEEKDQTMSIKDLKKKLQRKVGVVNGGDSKAAKQLIDDVLYGKLVNLSRVEMRGSIVTWKTL